MCGKCKCDTEPHTTIGALSVGDAFEYESNIYMKISFPTPAGQGPAGYCSCLRLNSGSVRGYMVWLPLTATIIVREIGVKNVPS